MFLNQKLWIFTVFLAVLSGVSAINVHISKENYEVLKGDSATLTCTFQSTITPQLAIISWSAVGTQPDDQEVLIITHYYPMKRTDVKPAYAGRFLLNVDVLRGKAMLRLSSVTSADDKIYECRVLIPGDDEGKSAATTRLVVNEPVSKPVCGIQGTVRSGENINLTCHSEKGSPPPSYRWERWHESVGSKRRFMAHTTTQNGGVLSLYDISNDTSGLYYCMSWNKIRTSTCEVHLSVLLDDSPGSDVFGAVGGAVAGVAGAAAGAVAGVAGAAARAAAGAAAGAAGAASGAAAGVLVSIASVADKIILGDGNNN
ncbi:cell surface A33 antigen-like [Salarias fasciatus]|uniref:Cell surface A33 antigen-like n=1 Tax=Salarias fasciatus TaxID=181472 RepID=A0A672G3R5_SALFA|nr:cell surface A33 antigen-like [Salarias fasciatus]